MKSCCSWSLLYNTTLRSQADSLRSHAILHEWLTFYSVFLNIQLKWCTYSTDMAGASWNCCCLGAFRVHHTTCHFMQSHICKVHLCLAVTCQLHFWQNDWGSFMCYCCKMRGGMDAEIRVSTEENSPASHRRKFSCCSCRGSNPRPTFQSWILHSNHWATPLPIWVDCWLGLLGPSSQPTSMCSAIQPSSRAMTLAMRRAKHFLPSRELPP